MEEDIPLVETKKEWLRRISREKRGDLSCTYCPPNRGENGHKPQNGWKKKRKTPRQFRRIVDMFSHMTH